MLHIEGIRLTPDEGENLLVPKAAELLRVPPQAIELLNITRKSVDAREDVRITYCVNVKVKSENKILARVRSRGVTVAEKKRYSPPASSPAFEHPPVVVGAGPAGLFCALTLAKAGARPILLERGQGVVQRRQDVEFFWKTGLLNKSSNVQFGEGGAGTFSDGKLSTGTHDARNRYILEQLVLHGAPPEILVDAKPHIGTDRLIAVLENIRADLAASGCDMRCGAKMESLDIRGGAVRGVNVLSCCSGGALPAEHVVLAVGHSARDTFETLYRLGVPMEAKRFAVGVRIEHLQRDIDAAQYKKYAGHPALPASSYKLACHLENGRSAFSFCVCPGGQVVAAASEDGRLVTNGMSEYARDGENINGGLLVGVGPEDFGSDSPLAGMEFQRRLEEAAFRLGGGGFAAPVQRVGDFLAGRPSSGPGKVVPTYRPSVRWTDLRGCLPDFICDTIAGALPIFNARIAGFADGDAVMTAVETRSSSPVQITRGDTLQSSVRGLYPCGEGAGYAGGIMSAAADGIRCAEKILEGN
jgi:uncharacterized FAD-dependent dehydrogenase